MAVHKHIDWLLEGVEAWNARRKREDFRPDFQGADIRGAFEAAGKPVERGGFDLKGANLGGADLEGANLGRADLRRANLGGAELEGANLGGAVLEEANLGRSDLGGANLGGADLIGAIVGTIVYWVTGTSDDGVTEYTDLSSTRNLSQGQVDVMEGDSGTILPEGITRPDEWPEIKTIDDINDDQLSQVTSPTETLSPALRQQIAFLLRVAPSAADTALHTASQIELAVSEARLNTGDEPALFLQVAIALKSLGNALSQANDKDIEIAKLEAIVATQRAEIERLTSLIADMPSAKAQIMVAALGGAGATAITGTLGFMFGSDGADMINNLMQFFDSGGGLPPPPQQLPPTVST